MQRIYTYQVLTLLGLESPFGGQFTEISRSLTPKRDCGSKRVNTILRDRAHLGWDGAERDLAETESANPRGAVAVEDRLDGGVEQVFRGARR